MDYENEFQRRMKNHEPATNKKLAELALQLPKDSVVVDCGAHLSTTGLKLARALKAGNRNDITIYEIEPAKDKMDFIQNKAKENDIQCFKYINAGLWNKNVDGKLERKSNNAGAWTVKECETGSGEFKMVKLDDVIPRLDLLHLDVEGSEYKALMGSKDLLEKYHPAIVMEVIHDSDKAVEYLKSIGYSEKETLKPYDKLFIYTEKEKLTGSPEKQVNYWFLVPIIVFAVILFVFIISCFRKPESGKLKTRKKR